MESRSGCKLDELVQKEISCEQTRKNTKLKKMKLLMHTDKHKFKKDKIKLVSVSIYLCIPVCLCG